MYFFLLECVDKYLWVRLNFEYLLSILGWNQYEWWKVWPWLLVTREGCVGRYLKQDGYL